MKQIAGDEFLFMADAHIKARTWSYSGKLAGDAYEALDSLYSDQLPSSLIIGGDWFDSNRPISQDLLETAAFFNNFNKIHFIRGNHDGCNPSWLSCLPNAAHAGPVAVSFKSFDVHMVDWCHDREELLVRLDETGVANRKRPAVLVLHTGMKKLMARDGVWQLDDSDIETIAGPSKIPLLVLVGHIHTRKTWAVDKVNATIHSPGSLFPVTLDEFGISHAVTEVEWRQELGDFMLKSRTTDVRLYGSVDKPEDMKDAVADLVKKTQKSNIPLAPVIVANFESPEGFVQPNNAIVVFADDPKNEPMLQTTRQAPVSTMADAVAACCEGLDPDLRDMALALLNAQDPKQELENWLQTWGVLKR